LNTEVTEGHRGKRLERKTWHIPDEWERTTESVIGAAMDVHSALGPGLLERIYSEALRHELQLRGHRVSHEVAVTIVYRGLLIEGQRIDLLVDDLVVIELKAVEKVADVHLAQLMSYLRSARKPLGLLLNFNVLRMKDGIHRRVNERALPSPAAPVPAHPSVPLRDLRVQS
jgi:GxxExxY protein